VKNIISLKKVNKSYFNQDVEIKVLHSIDLDIHAGDINSIIGQSGSGKSTLMNIMGTLDQPSSGSIVINGIETSRMKADELARLRNETIGFVFQFHYLLPEFTVIENVLMPYNLRMKAGKVETSRAKELLELVGLKDVTNSLSTRISGGQQQRTAIARALMNKPAMILADEPTGNLDSDTTEKIYKLFCRINKELKTTFVIITHDDRIAKKANHIVTISDGRITKKEENPHTSCVDKNFNL